MIPGVLNPRTNLPVATLKINITTNKLPITVNRSKFFISTISRILPAKHILDFCATAPKMSPPTSDRISGAWILPGPASLAFKSDVHVARIRIPTMMTGSTAPLVLFVS